MPYFIVLEGLDGVGKSTLVRRLAHECGYQRMTTPGADILPMRSDIMDRLGSSQTARALFYAATVQAEGEKALAFNKQGKTIVMDFNDIPVEVWDELRARKAAHRKSKYRLVTREADAIIEPQDGEKLVLPAHLLPRM